jgi:hypothetical protein
MRPLVIIAIALAVVVVASGVIVLMLRGNDPVVNEQLPPAPSAPVEQERQASDVVLEVPVQLTAQFFNPASFSVAPGDTVVLVIESIDIDHVVFIANNATSIPIPKGTTAQIRVQPTDTFSLLCTDGCESDVALRISVA